MPSVRSSPQPARAPILRAEILSVGSEILVGETRDANAGELARSIAAEGVLVTRLSAVPDELAVVSEAFERALERADLVISTGGLGPTPDDLTREAIAHLLGETPVVDPVLERWLRALWARRGMPFPEANLKQAWLIPSASAISNPNGTAPGWWVETRAEKLVVAMPGPPREMRAMWSERVLPMLRERGLGREHAAKTYRLMGIGESQVADLLGEPLLRAPNPIVATYARAEAVDVRISAVAEPARDGRPARGPEELVAEAAAIVLAAVGAYVWAEGDETWHAAIGRRLSELDWRLSTIEIGTGGSLVALLADAPWLVSARSIRDVPNGSPILESAAWAVPREETAAPEGDGSPGPDSSPDGVVSMERLAEAAREEAHSEVGLAVRVRPHGSDTRVDVAVALPDGAHSVERLAFLGGAQGRSRAALLAAAELLAQLRAVDVPFASLHQDAGTGELAR